MSEPERQRRIVVATADTLGSRMAGPAIRAWHIARALAANHEVRLVTTGSATIDGDGFTVEATEDRDLRLLIDWCDVFVFQGWILAGRPFLTDSNKVLIADIYDPMHLEQLEQGHEAGKEGRWSAVRGAVAVLNDQLKRADFMICASEKQRDFWLGQLAGLGRVNHRTYDEDPTLRSLLDVVPFGIADEPPVRTAPGVKGVVPGIGPNDELVLWGGGIYNWLDPLSVIRAIDQLRARRPNVRLLFMGLRHPNPEIPEMQMAVAAQRLSNELGLTGSHVLFNEEWVPYDERQNTLLDADVGVSTHLDHVETAFAFRTRILDYLWASVPVVATSGDALAELVQTRGLGITVSPGDVDGIARAIESLLADTERAKECRANIDDVVPTLRWSSVLEPIVRFCSEPRRAPDFADEEIVRDLRKPLRLPASTKGFAHDVRLIWRHLRTGGPRLLLRRIRSRLRRIVNARAD